MHGEQNEMSRLKAALEREYEEERLSQIEIYTPRNTQAFELHFKGEKIAKVVGSLAGEELREGQCVSGVLAKRGFKYHLIDPAELPSECVCVCVCVQVHICMCTYVCVHACTRRLLLPK